jgi:hypothetical protein
VATSALAIVGVFTLPLVGVLTNKNYYQPLAASW